MDGAVAFPLLTAFDAAIAAWWCWRRARRLTGPDAAALRRTFR